MRQRDELNRIQNGAAAEALAQLERLWPSLEVMAPEEARDVLLEIAPGLVDRWGSVAGTATAEWYEERREAALGSPGEARLSEVDTQAVEGSVRWAARDLFTPGRSGRARKRMSEVIDRHVRNMSRGTIAQSIDADSANVRWARMMSGSETCGWCRMLASRGFVYKSEETAGGNHAWGHDNCDCQVVPDFALSEAEHEQYQAEVDTLYGQYSWVIDQTDDIGRGESPTADRVAKEWRQYIIDYDTAADQLSKQRGGTSADGSVSIPEWDDARRQLVAELEREFPDGFGYGRQLMPRNPSQPPSGWGPGADMPALDAEVWNRALYGYDGTGGHMAGYGWAGGDAAEFPKDWTPSDISNAFQSAITGGTAEETGAGTEYRHTVDGQRVTVTVRETDDGTRFVTSARLS